MGLQGMALLVLEEDQEVEAVQAAVVHLELQISEPEELEEVLVQVVIEHVVDQAAQVGVVRVHIVQSVQQMVEVAEARVAEAQGMELRPLGKEAEEAGCMQLHWLSSRGINILLCS